MSANRNDQLRRAILECLCELNRTHKGTHGHETVGGGVAVNVRKRTGATLDDFASNLSYLVEAGLVSERRQLRIFSSGHSVDYLVYSIAGPGLVEIEGESKMRVVEGHPIEALPKATRFGESYFRNLEVSLLDFVQQEFRIVDRIFEDCVISGPAVIDLLRTHIDDQCVFFVTENGDATVSIPPKGTLAGALTVKDCIFRRCRFRNVAVVVRMAQEHLPTATRSAET
ncbi:MAG: hypothetical protein OER43_16350 [Gammaproteobacteria bacterium]|nr:hypothetical protein [Gammaproteobacteria bacterium]